MNNEQWTSPSISGPNDRIGDRATFPYTQSQSALIEKGGGTQAEKPVFLRPRIFQAAQILGSLEVYLETQLDVTWIGHFGIARRARCDAAEVFAIRIVVELLHAIRVCVRKVEHLDAKLEAHPLGDLRCFVEREIGDRRRVQPDGRRAERGVAR